MQSAVGILNRMVDHRNDDANTLSNININVAQDEDHHNYGLGEEEVDLTGDSLYWINRDSQYNSCLVDGKFSPFNFVLGDSEEDIEKSWATGPILEFKNGNEPLSKFPTYLKQFVHLVYARLGDIFPYEAPRDVILKVATMFSSHFQDLDLYFLQYKKQFPKSQMGKSVDVIVSE